VLVIYIDSLNWRKFFTFYYVWETKSWHEKRQLLCMWRKQDDVNGL